MKKIREINNSYKPINCQKIKVCAYARVSRDNLDAFHSLEAQKEYYTRLYKYSPDYEFIEAFCDFGISGIKESRPAFDEMLRRARNKEFDLIVTKSISRFARNILLLIKVIRELRDIGVAIFFEKEGINTMNIEGEMLLSIYGSVAEEERKQVSTNIKWSIQRQYLKGNPCLNFNKIFGYDEDFIVN
ncbi:MAG: recombinase family protein, partial [Firmicutes bacterium]|nr:recombinase family protein [Bacillota bacterium]